MRDAIVLDRLDHRRPSESVAFRAMRLRLVRTLRVLPLLTLLLAVPASAATYFLSPSGTDRDAGTSPGHAWQTWSRVFRPGSPVLRPGDTLRLLDGKYTKADTGFLSANCGGKRPNAESGSQNAPIRIMAQNERRAWLSGDGSDDTFRLTDCSYYEVVGLMAEAGDNRGQMNGGQPFRFLSTANGRSRGIVFRRNLVRRNNRYSNSHLVSFEHVDEVRAEENEFYEFHRHAVLVYYSDGGVYRRNYANSRFWADLPDARESGYPKVGDDAITIYPGSNNLVENNLSEGNGNFASIQATAVSKNNRFFGNVSLNDLYGVLLKARGDRSEQMPEDSRFRDLAVVGSAQAGFYARAARKTVCDHCTVMPQHGLAFVADENARGPRGDGRYSIEITNSIARPIGSGSHGILMENQADWRIDRVWSSGHGVNFRPSPESPQITNSRSVDPEMGPCRLWIPDGSPAKGAASDGKDLGATILYRYEDGSLTSQPLWDRTTGAFLAAGATVAGVNDISGVSLFDVQNRLNVGRNGCAFPAGYATTASNGPTPPAP